MEIMMMTMMMMMMIKATEKKKDIAIAAYQYLKRVLCLCALHITKVISFIFFLQQQISLLSNKSTAAVAVAAKSNN
jgi:hypothetical protein